MNGATLKLVFAAGLAEPSDLGALRFDFQVRGAGGIGADDKERQPEPDGDRSPRGPPKATASAVWN